MQLSAKEKAAAAAATTPLRRMHDVVLATLSLDALRASVGTVIAQQHAAPVNL
jgi:hypothetical protein